MKNTVNITGDGNVIGHGNTLSVAKTTHGNIHIHPPTMSALHQLTPVSPDFVGRRSELTVLLEKMDGAGVAFIGLQGMGGVGKTALALMLAHRLTPRFPDAQFHLDLRGGSASPLSVPEAMSRIVRAYHPTLPLPDSDAELAGIYRSVLHGQKALLVLDNANDTAQVESLLPSASCAVVVTSRQRIHIGGLQMTSLDVLTGEDARELLLLIAPRIGEIADTLAQRCGFLPLAMRLAASFLATRPNVSPEYYVQQLSDLLSRPEMEPVEASLQLSFDGLGPMSQQRWCALGVFPATFNVWAAMTIWQVALDQEAEIARGVADELLGELLSHSLIEWDASSERYRLHDLARDFAVRTCAKRSELKTAREHHANHYLAVLDRAKELYQEGEDSLEKGLKLFDEERVNIDAGQTWAATHEDERKRLALGYVILGDSLLDVRLSPSEYARWLEAALPLAQQLDERRDEVDILSHLGLAYHRLGQAQRALDFHQQALALARAIDYRHGERVALDHFGLTYQGLGEMRRAIDSHEQALTLAREIGDRPGEASALGNIGLAYFRLDEVLQAIEYLDQQLLIAEEVGDLQVLVGGLCNLGLAYRTLDEPHLAIQCHEKGLSIACKIGDRRGENAALGNLATAYGRVKQPRRAMQYHERALALSCELGDRQGESVTLGNIGLTYRDSGEMERAIEYHERSLAIARDIGDRSGQSVQLINLGWIYHEVGQIERAKEHAEQALAIARDIGDRRCEGLALFGVAEALDVLGERERAIDMGTKALELLETIKDSHVGDIRGRLYYWRANVA